MRRMIPQKQIEGLEDLNEMITVQTHGIAVNVKSGSPTEIIDEGIVNISGGDNYICAGEDGLEISDIAGVILEHDSDPVASFNKNKTVINSDTIQIGSANAAAILTTHSNNVNISTYDPKTRDILAGLTAEDTGIYIVGYDQNGDNTGKVLLNPTGVAIYGDVDGTGSGYIYMPDLPTSDPKVEGALWNDNGVLKISAGE